jgi:hypothetical protein
MVAAKVKVKVAGAKAHLSSGSSSNHSSSRLAEGAVAVAGAKAHPSSGSSSKCLPSRATVT